MVTPPRCWPARPDLSRFVLITGCSGGGKSTLLAELAAHGCAVVEEPGRRIVRQELAGDGRALPWVDGVAFAWRAVAMALDDLAASVRAPPGWVFFDRGLIDAASALESLTGEPPSAGLNLAKRYHRRVFLAPPWPEIFAGDAERRHDLSQATAEYDRLAAILPRLGYEAIGLPRVNVSARATFVLEILGAAPLSPPTA